MTMDRKQWLAARRKGIGASDTPEILGIGWNGNFGPQRIYQSKLYDMGGDEPTEGPAAAGIALEALVAERYSHTFEVDLEKCDLMTHPEHSFILATPDYRREDNGQYVQIKTCAGFGDEWGECGSDDIPYHYLVQVTQEMAVTGTQQIDVAALDRISWTTRFYRIEFDQDLWNHLLDVITRFWFEHVVAERDPGYEWHQQFLDLVPVNKDLQLVLGDDVAELVAKYKRFGEIEKRAKEQADALRETLQSIMGDASSAIAGEYKLTRSLIAGRMQQPYWKNPYVSLRVTQSKKRGKK